MEEYELELAAQQQEEASEMANNQDCDADLQMPSVDGGRL